MLVHYHKRKNDSLFKQLNDVGSLHIIHTQNYTPIYQRLFALNNTNYNNINLNHDWYITTVHEHENNRTSHNIYECQIKHTETKKTKTKENG